VSLDERQFRDALGAFATGVAVVTGRNDAGERLGITVSSFNSVSITPPLVLFSIARQAHSYPTWAALRSYAVNILSQQQEEISNRFARPLGDKWDGLTVLDGATGLPILPNALAVFECEAYARYAGGDHDIFVGKVLHFRTHAHKQEEPLVFFGGRYRRLDEGFRDPLPRDASIFDGW
jgi:flavin reductase (DIM6/NTAB) family NADH-FMN oxidoreductase RutF